jgi:hypothetical protein
VEREVLFASLTGHERQKQSRNTHCDAPPRPYSQTNGTAKKAHQRLFEW